MVVCETEGSGFKSWSYHIVHILPLLFTTP